MTESDRLERIEKAVAILIGAGLGGLPGARLGASAVQLHQLSPLHDLEVAGIHYLEGQLRQARSRSPTEDRLFDSQGSSKRSLKKKRKPTAYNKRYSKCFKKLQPKYKKKNGSWKKDGFKRCSNAARKCAK